MDNEEQLLNSAYISYKLTHSKHNIIVHFVTGSPVVRRNYHTLLKRTVHRGGEHRRPTGKVDIVFN